MNKKQLENDKNLKQFIPFKSGLINLNNTCYMNSIVTCISQIDDFLVKFGSKEMSPLFSTLNNKSLFKVLHHLIIGHYQNKDYLDFLLEAFVNNILKKDIFQRGQQNDANEFLVFLISWLAEEISQLISTNVSQNLFVINGLNECMQFLKEDLKIKLLCNIDCKQSGCKTTKIEEEFLVLNVKNNDTGISFNNINSCINGYFKPVSLTCICSGKRHNITNNQCQAFYCETCLGYGDAKITKSIISFPKNLVVNFLIFDQQNVSQKKYFCLNG
jgi:uncharacterized UBP type Zn finger protein